MVFTFVLANVGIVFIFFGDMSNSEFNKFVRQYLRLLSIMGLVLCGVAFLVTDNILDNPNYSVFIQGKLGTSSQKEISFPYRHKNYVKYWRSKYTVKFDQGEYSDSRFIISPDNCVIYMFINGNWVDIRKHRTCDFTNGFEVNLSEHLTVGENTLVIKVTNRRDKRGEYGLNVQRKPSIFYLLGAVMFACAAMLVAYSVVRKSGLNRSTAAIFLATIPYYIFWLYHSPVTAHSSDVLYHIDFINYISENWSRPYDFWQREHYNPPLYYYIMAFLKNISAYIYSMEAYTALRLFSIPLYFTFCLYGVKTLKTVIGRENITYYASALLIVFWPLSISMATRINNDIALYAVWAATFYYLVRWYQEKNIGALQVAAGLVALACMIKTTGIIPLGILGACVLYALLIGHTQWRQLFLKRSLLMGAAVVLGIVVNLGKVIYLKFFFEGAAPSQHLGEYGRFVPTLEQYFSFNITHYFAQPFATAAEPDVLNFFLKTMLYGNGRIMHEEFAVVLNLLFLVFLGIIILATIINLLARKERISNLMPYIISIVVSLLAITLYALKQHWFIGHNFRYILPMLVPLIILFALAMESIKTMKWASSLYWLGIVSVIGLSVGGVVFYLARYLW